MADQIQGEYRQKMNALANLIDEFLGGPGFTLLVYDMNKPVNGRINFISNSQREDVVTAMKEFIAQDEGRWMQTPKATQ